jgi:predicted acetyltransferase
MTIDAFLRNRIAWSAGLNLRADWVPFTTFWLLDDSGTVVGVSRLRHRLNDFLLNHGSHIGYYVKASERGKAYGTQVLALTLTEARGLGLEPALLTVDSDNEPSIRVSERNGGALEEECIDETTSRLHRRYWIDLR